MEQKSRLTTLCYIENEGAYLMLHRISKKNDVNKDKWIGVGGHFEGNESPEDCLLREVREETGLTLTSWRFRGLVTFKAEGWDTEYMCLYTADKYEGDRLTEAVLNGKQMELFDVLDEDGKKTGVVRERSLVHMDGVPHGTAHIWVVRKNEDKTYDLLLQKRSRGKDSYPGCYDISSAGHVQAGDEFLPSAIRELKEELGIEAKEEDLEFAGFHMGYMEDMFYGNMFRDSEVSAVYVYRKTVDADQLTLQKEEVESVMWMELGQCVEAVRNHGIPNCIYLDELEMIERYLCRSQEK